MNDSLKDTMNKKDNKIVEEVNDDISMLKTQRKDCDQCGRIFIFKDSISSSNNQVKCNVKAS